MKKIAEFTAKVMAVLMVTTIVLGSNTAKALASEENINTEAALAATGAAFEIVPAEEIAEVPAEEPAVVETPVEEPVVEEPAVVELEKDFYMVFSIAKVERVDNSNGTTSQSKDAKDYFQIKGVAPKSEEDRKNPKDNKKIGRYNILINEAQVFGLMADVLGTTALTKNLNETNGNKIGSYSVERTESIDSSKAMIETVLSQLGVLDEVNAMTRAFVTNKSNSAVSSFLASKYPEIDFDGDNWYIDWYVMKTQTNGIHVDGVFVTVYDAEPVVENIEAPAEEIVEVPVEEIPEVPAAPAAEAGEAPAEEIAEVPAAEADEVPAEAVEVPAAAADEAPVDEIIETPAEAVEAPVEETVEKPVSKMAVEIPYLPPFVEPEEEEIAPATAAAVEMNDVAADETEEELTVEITEVPAGAPEETVETLAIENTEVPAGTPDEAEEIEVEITEVPAGDVLPQTGLANVAWFYGFGAALMLIGAIAVLTSLRKRENR